MNRIYKVIYSEVRNGYIVVSELACRHGRSTHSGRRKAAMTAAILTALVSLSWTGMTAEAAVQSKPLVVTEKGQTVTDDFDVKNCTNRAVLEIASSAAAGTDGVTAVDSKNITGTFTLGGDENHAAEANGIWVQDKYPRTVNLADEMTVKVDATGNHYHSSGIYLEGVDTHHGNLNESDAANKEYENNGNQISSTTVKVGDGTTVTVNAKAPEGKKTGTFVNANSLENHFGHMTVRDNVHLNLTTGAFQENYAVGFKQLFYGDTSIGNGFTSTVTGYTDKDSKIVRVQALESAHDYDHGAVTETSPAKTLNRLRIGDDARLEIVVNDSNGDSYSANQDNQEINEAGALLSSTDFTIENRMKVVTEQSGVSDRQVDIKHPYKGNDSTGVVGIGIQFSKGSFGDDLDNKVCVKNRNLDFVYGSYLNHGLTDSSDESIAGISMGDHAVTRVDIHDSLITGGNAVIGIDVANNTRLKMGQSSKVSVDIHNSKVAGRDEIDEKGKVKHINGYTYGILANEGSQANIGAYGNLSMSQTGGISQYTIGIGSQSRSVITMGNNFQTNMDISGQASRVYAIHPESQGVISIGDGWNTSTAYAGDTNNNFTIGAFTFTQGKLTVGDNSIINVSGQYTGEQPNGNVVGGLRNNRGTSVYGNHLTVAVQGDNYETVEGFRGFSRQNEPAEAVIGDGLHMTVNASALKGNDKGPFVYGIKNSGADSTVTVGKDAHITLSAPSAVQDLAALRAWNQGNIQLGDGAVLAVNSAAAKNNNVVKADSAGKVTFDGGMTLSGSQDAIYSTGDGSSVTALGEGRKVILGDLESADKGIINLNLNTGDSLFRGASTVNGGNTELALAKGALWDMTDSSQLTKLDHRNGGIINMTYSNDYQTLDIGNFIGQDGTFRMKTDLDSQTDGDKVHIGEAAAGSQGRVQVYDKSFLTGKEVTGVKNLLLITDASKNAVFTGASLDKGGLWDVTPTLQRGNTVKDAQGNIVGKDTEWYLTKIAKTVNHDTKPLLGATDYAYGAYRMDIETLRQRMGELRFLNNKQDASGIWARMYGGAFDGPSFDSRYHALQLGYDYAANPKSFYGWFGERGIASPHYDYGTSSNHSLAAGIYGTWFGDSGAYTDAVAKWGRDDANLHTFGPYPDQANYRTRAASLSLEYGKTMKLNDKGLFLEPQAQLVYGHLGSTHYTTAREKQVHLDDYESFIGRVGFVFGRRTPDATKPLDYYLRLSALHEFGGRRDLHLSAADGETMDWSTDYGSTWYEASLGGTCRLNDRTTLYGDLQRTFGSDWHKKWQGNVGINWQF